MIRNLKLVSWQIFAALAAATLLCNCSSVDKDQYYEATISNEWQKKDVTGGHYPSIGGGRKYLYGYKCNESLFWISPSGATRVLMIGPPFIPFFPLFLSNKLSTGGNQELTITLYSDKNLLPILTPENGLPMKPLSSEAYSDYTIFKYNLEVAKINSFTINIESGGRCVVSPLMFTKRTALKYTLFQ